MASTLKSNQPSKTELLLDGYIRQIQAILKTQIIPESINKLCFTFYYYSKLLFCVTSNYHSDTGSVHIADIHSDKSDKSLLSQNIETVKGWSVFLGGNCLTTKFTSFPSKLSNKFNVESTNVIFISGGYSYGATKHCNALIIDTNTWNIHNWKLPDCTYSIYGSTAGFLPHSQSLIKCGGDDGRKVNGLFFNDNKEDGMWKWKELTSMKSDRYNPSSTIIDNKLMVVGGRTINVEIYDVDKDKWTNLASMKYQRIAPGIHYNNSNNDVYIVGGFNSNDDGKGVEHYDFHKNQWNADTIPLTQFSHKCHALLWMENNNLLYVASIPSKSDDLSHGQTCEYIDLRVCKKWETVYKGQMLSKLFGISSSISVHCCLLQN